MATDKERQAAMNELFETVSYQRNGKLFTEVATPQEDETPYMTDEELAELEMV